MVEQRTENPRVPSSSLGLGTSNSKGGYKTFEDPVAPLFLLYRIPYWGAKKYNKVYE